MRNEDEFTIRKDPVLTEDELYRKCILDKVKDGLSLAMHGDEFRVTIDNITSFLNQLHIKPDEDAVIDLIRDASLDSEGIVDSKQLHTVVKKEVLPSYDVAEESIRKAFNLVDVDGDGVITGADLYRLMLGLGTVVSDEQLMRMLKAVDTDGDGRASYEDFRCFLYGIDVAPPVTPKTVDPQPEPIATPPTEPPEESLPALPVIKITPRRNESDPVVHEKRRRLFSYGDMIVKQLAVIANMRRIAEAARKSHENQTQEEEDYTEEEDRELLMRRRRGVRMTTSMSLPTGLSGFRAYRQKLQSINADEEPMDDSGSTVDDTENTKTQRRNQVVTDDDGNMYTKYPKNSPYHGRSRPSEFTKNPLPPLDLIGAVGTDNYKGLAHFKYRKLSHWGRARLWKSVIGLKSSPGSLASHEIECGNREISANDDANDKTKGEHMSKSPFQRRPESDLTMSRDSTHEEVDSESDNSSISDSDKEYETGSEDAVSCSKPNNLSGRKKMTHTQRRVKSDMTHMKSKSRSRSRSTTKECESDSGSDSGFELSLDLPGDNPCRAKMVDIAIQTSSEFQPDTAEYGSDSDMAQSVTDVGFCSSLEETRNNCTVTNICGIPMRLRKAQKIERAIFRRRNATFDIFPCQNHEDSEYRFHSRSLTRRDSCRSMTPRHSFSCTPRSAREGTSKLHDLNDKPIEPIEPYEMDTSKIEKLNDNPGKQENTKQTAMQNTCKCKRKPIRTVSGNTESTKEDGSIESCNEIDECDEKDYFSTRRIFEKTEVQCATERRKSVPGTMELNTNAQGRNKPEKYNVRSSSEIHISENGESKSPGRHNFHRSELPKRPQTARVEYRKENVPLAKVSLIEPSRGIQRPQTARVDLRKERLMSGRNRVCQSVQNSSESAQSKTISIVEPSQSINSEEIYAPEIQISLRHHGFRSIRPLARVIMAIQSTMKNCKKSPPQVSSVSRCLEENRIPTPRSGSSRNTVPDNKDKGKSSLLNIELPVEKTFRPKLKRRSTLSSLPLELLERQL